MAPRSLDLPRFMSPEVGLPPARVDEDPFLVEKRSAAAGCGNGGTVQKMLRCMFTTPPSKPPAAAVPATTHGG